jgi:hypothetical protein
MLARSPSPPEAFAHPCIGVHLGQYVKPKWKDARPAEVRTTDAQVGVSELSTRRSASVTFRAFGILAGILDDGVSDRLIARTPSAFAV